MNPINGIFTPKELAHLFVDGEITEVEQASLFRSLANDAELQEYLAGAMRAKQVIDQYRTAATIPETLFSAISAEAFGSATNALSSASSSSLGFVLRFGLTASISAALLTGGVGLRSLPKSESSAAIAPQHREVVANTSNSIPPATYSLARAATISPNTPKYINNKLEERRQEQISIDNASVEKIRNKPTDVLSIGHSALIEQIETSNPIADAPNISPTSNAEILKQNFHHSDEFSTILKDFAGTLGGFGGANSFGSPTRLAGMYIINHEVAVGLQYNTRSYRLTTVVNDVKVSNPTATGVEAIAQYTENSDILPFGMKPIVNGAAGYSRLGPTAFFFAGVSAEPIDVISVQAGVEGNLLFYNDHGSNAAAGGLRMAMNIGVKF